MRKTILFIAIVALLVYLLVSLFNPWAILYLSPLPLFAFLAFWDAFQKGDAIRRQYPVLGRLSRLLEEQKHVIQEILLLNRKEGAPFDEVHKEIAVHRAMGEKTNQPFGTDYDLYKEGMEYARHSMFPKSNENIYRDHRFDIGGPKCTKPYSSSFINVAGMSYGSISEEAIKALSIGAAKAHFALNTGEGGYADFHSDEGNDVIFQFGTAYFGCRTEEGNFDPDKFREIAQLENVKMTEIKVSQGAKPSYGAILPAKKNTPQIAKVRNINAGEKVESPPNHAEFDDPYSLCGFIKRLRDLSDGKPVGIKFCLGREEDFVDMVKAFKETGDGPDYIAIDGSEGGTGAAHFEALHFTGMPLALSLNSCHRILKDQGLRNQIKIIASGKQISSFDMLRTVANGADGIYIARGFMFALGCVQSLKCNKNICPVGLTTMDKSRRKALVPSDKGQKVYNFHINSLKGINEMLSSLGLTSVYDFTKEHFRAIKNSEETDFHAV
jgi:glutamate synthase domain-containing protein 2